MKDLVDKILQEEQSARQRLEAARKAAESMLQQAQLEAKNILQRSVQEETAAVEKDKTAALEEMSGEKQKSLDKTRAEVLLKSEAGKKKISAAAERIFRQVIDIQD